MKQSNVTKTSYHIPVGPIHPALKEPVYFEFEVEGEKIAFDIVSKEYIYLK